MGKRTAVILPKTQDILEQMGEQIKLARLRRKLSTELVAERAGISRATLWSIEKGSPTVAIGMYAAVLHALNNMDQDLLLIAKDDELGEKIAGFRINNQETCAKGKKKVVMEEKVIYVYENWSTDVPALLGRLYVSHIRGKEQFSFEYDTQWLTAETSKFFLDPDLDLYSGRHFVPMDKRMFGIFADSCPDRWGDF